MSLSLSCPRAPRQDAAPRPVPSRTSAWRSGAMPGLSRVTALGDTPPDPGTAHAAHRVGGGKEPSGDVAPKGAALPPSGMSPRRVREGCLSLLGDTQAGAGGGLPGGGGGSSRAPAAVEGPCRAGEKRCPGLRGRSLFFPYLLAEKPGGWRRGGGLREGGVQLPALPSLEAMPPCSRRQCVLSQSCLIVASKDARGRGGGGLEGGRGKGEGEGGREAQDTTS